MPEKHPPKAVIGRDPLDRRDPWKRLRERPGVKVLDIARRSPRER